MNQDSATNELVILNKPVNLSEPQVPAGGPLSESAGDVNCVKHLAP